jgi:hypothetical protein
MDNSTQKLKDMIQRMTELDTPKQIKKKITEAITISGDSADEIASLMKMLGNAGISQPEASGVASMPVRQDMERLAGIMGGSDFAPEMGDPETSVSNGDPEVVVGNDEEDLPMGEEVLTDGWSSQDATELESLHGLLMSAANGDRSAAAKFEDYVDNEFRQPSGDPVDGNRLRRRLSKMDQGGQIDMLHKLIRDSNRADVDDTDSSMKKGEMGLEGYDNEPDEEYQDTNYMTKDISGGLNREKKAYAKAQDGDNAMAVESIKDRLYAMLSEKKEKPDFADIDDDGDKKEPMKKAAKDKKAVNDTKAKK